MVRYGADLRELMDPIWEEEYLAPDQGASSV